MAEGDCIRCDGRGWFHRHESDARDDVRTPCYHARTNPHTAGALDAGQIRLVRQVAAAFPMQTECEGPHPSWGPQLEPFISYVCHQVHDSQVYTMNLKAEAAKALIATLNGVAAALVALGDREVLLHLDSGQWYVFDESTYDGVTALDLHDDPITALLEWHKAVTRVD